MAFADDLEAQVRDEQDAYYTYLRMAMEADKLGRHELAIRLRGIANDEERHYNALSAEFLPEERPAPLLNAEELRGRQARERAEEFLERVSQPLTLEHRPYPQTYGDWVNLAEDIKIRDPDSAPTVNDRLNVICFEEGDVDAAKHWLVDKAHELGIK